MLGSGGAAHHDMASSRSSVAHLRRRQERRSWPAVLITSDHNIASERCKFVLKKKSLRLYWLRRSFGCTDCAEVSDSAATKVVLSKILFCQCEGCFCLLSPAHEAHRAREFPASGAPTLQYVAPPTARKSTVRSKLPE